MDARTTPPIPEIKADTAPVMTEGPVGSVVLWHANRLHMVGQYSSSDVIRQATIYDFAKTPESVPDEVVLRDPSGDLWRDWSEELRTLAGFMILCIIVDDPRCQLMMTTLSIEDRVDAILEDLGCRVTGPRREVARLLASKQGSFSAESINEELPDVGRATVYRTLKLLSDADVLCKTILPDGSPRYSFDHSWHHHHLICTSCGRVEEFRNSELERLLCELATQVDGEVLEHRVELYVTCTDCLRHVTFRADQADAAPWRGPK